MLSVGWGIDAQKKGDPYIKSAEDTMGVMAASTLSAITSLLEVYPWLRFIPDWFPGAGFKKRASEAKKIVDGLPALMLANVKKAMKDGKAKSSVVSRAFQQLEEEGKLNAETEIPIRDVATSMVAGRFNS